MMWICVCMWVQVLTEARDIRSLELELQAFTSLCKTVGIAGHGGARL